MPARDFSQIIRNMTDEQRRTLFSGVEAEFRKVNGITDQDVRALRGIMLTESNGGTVPNRPGSRIQGPFQINTDPRQGVLTDLVQAGVLSRADASRVDVNNPLQSAHVAALYWQLNKQRVGDNPTNLALAYNAGPTKVRQFQRLKAAEQAGPDLRRKFGRFEGGRYRPTPDAITAEDRNRLGDHRRIIIDPDEFADTTEASEAKIKEVREYPLNVQEAISAVDSDPGFSGAQQVASADPLVLPPNPLDVVNPQAQPDAQVLAAGPTAPGQLDPFASAPPGADQTFGEPAAPSFPDPGTALAQAPTDPLTSAPAVDTGGRVPLPSENPQLLQGLASVLAPTNPVMQLMQELQLDGMEIPGSENTPLSSYLDYLLDA